MVPTPLGNLKDFTFRALEILQSVDYIAAETPSLSRKLLSHYQIKKPLLTFREQNREKAAQQILALLREGKTVALICDAGTPGISDPGSFLIQQVIEEDLPLEVLPGPAALIPAWLFSGLLGHQMAFWGFPPRKSGERKVFLKIALDFQGAVIFYEAPHRLLDLLKDLEETAPQARTAVVREISKIHQESRRGDPRELLEHYSSHPPKGEIVVVAQGTKNSEAESSVDLPAALRFFEQRGISLRDGVDFLAQFCRVNKKAAYNLGLEIKAE